MLRNVLIKMVLQKYMLAMVLLQHYDSIIIIIAVISQCFLC